MSVAFTTMLVGSNNDCTGLKPLLYRGFCLRLLLWSFAMVFLVLCPGISKNCKASNGDEKSNSKEQASDRIHVSPEKLYEAVSGYMEGIHRSRSKSGSIDNKPHKQNRDPKRIVISKSDKSAMIESDLNLSRRRTQRGEFELASISLSRAFKIASSTHDDKIKSLKERLEDLKRGVAEPGRLEETYTSEINNSIGMKMVLLPGGTFKMGSSTAEVRRVRATWNIPENLADSETPAHSVELSRPFLIGKYGVTVGEFKQFVNETGYKTVAEVQGWGWGYDSSKKHWSKKTGLSWMTPGYQVSDDYPVTMVCHVDAESFCSWMSKREGHKYTLPTEAQWEYAARGGRDSLTYPWGNYYPDGKKMNFADRSSDLPWADRSVVDLHVFAAPVGNYEPNDFKLYDMAGNTWQLCSDYFDPKEYKRRENGRTVDPTGPKNGKTKVVRGGSWAFDACEARNAFRFGVDPKLCVDVSGFRVVRSSELGDRNQQASDTEVRPVAPLSDEHVKALFRRVKEMVESGKRLQARSFVDRVSDQQTPDKKCLEDSTGFVRNVLENLIDQSANKTSELFTNSLGMKMSRIPEGSFVMGSSEADIAWAMNVLAAGQPVSLENEYPFHKVRISRPFFISQTPVTVAQFKAFVDETGYVTDAEEENGGEVFDIKNNRFVKKDGSSWRNPGWQTEPNQPVTMITYHDASAFCEWLTAKERMPYKLPTEAQWEYAARGGIPMGQFPWGDQLVDGRRANYADKNTEFEWRDRDSDDGHKFVATVGSYEPNGYGLYDMAGNVLQWVRDYYVEDYYRFSPEIDPEGPGQGENRVMKGGDWTSGPVGLRCAFRGWARPDLALYNGGFRVIVDASSTQRPYHFSENFLTQEWVPNPDQREVAKAVAKEKERTAKLDDRPKNLKKSAPPEIVTSGVLIMDFTPKSDAKKSGFLKGDVIIEYDGLTDLNSGRLIAATAKTKKERKRAMIKFVRDGYEYSVNVPPGSLGISIMDTVLKGPFKRQDLDESDSPSLERDNKGKKKQWT